MLSKIGKHLQAFADKMTYRQWIIISGIISIFLGILIFLSIKQATKPVEQPAPVNNVRVVVAKSDIPAKTLISDSMLETREIPESAVPAGAIKNAKDIVNKYSRVAILKDDFLSRRKVLMDIRMAGFTGEIPADCRAVSVAISDVTGVAGFAQPGDYVDVMLISNKDGRMVGRILLQNVELLAINKVQVQEGAGSASTSNSSSSNSLTGAVTSQNNAQPSNVANTKTKAIDRPATATLALTPADVLKLVTESQDSTIYLSLRPYQPKDEVVNKTIHVHYSDPKAAMRNNMPSTNRNIPQQQQGNDQLAGSVEVVRGTAVTRE